MKACLMSSSQTPPLVSPQRDAIGLTIASLYVSLLFRPIRLFAPIAGLAIAIRSPERRCASTAPAQPSSPIPPDDPARHLTSADPDGAGSRHVSVAGGVYT